MDGNLDYSALDNLAKKNTRPGKSDVDAVLNGDNRADVLAFWDTVKDAEGGEPDLIVGGKERFDISGDHPNKVGLVTNAGASTAAGNYQITGSNWYGSNGNEGLKKRLGANNFDRDNQLRGAMLMFSDRENGAGLDALKSGNFEKAREIAKLDWTSVPGSTIGGGGQRSNEWWNKQFEKNKQMRRNGFKQLDALAGLDSQNNDALDKLNEPTGFSALDALADAPTFPQNTAPVKENDFAIREQIRSAADLNSPRAAVLLTGQNQIANLPPEQRDLFTPVQTPNGTLLVNNLKAANLKLKNPQDIFKYVEKNGFANLIGKVEDVGNNTSGGLTVRTTKDGKELTSSVVSPENIEAQKAVDLAAHPNADASEVLPTQDAALKRLQETEATDLASLGTAKVGETSFGANLAPAIEKPMATEEDYKSYFALTKKKDTPENRLQFDTLLKESDAENFGQNVNVIEPADLKPNQRIGALRRTPVVTAPNAQNQQASPTVQTPQTLAPGTADNLSRESLGVVPLDKIYKQKPTADEVINDAGVAAYGANFNRAANAYKSLTGTDLITYNQMRPDIEKDIETNYDAKKGLNAASILQVNREARVDRIVEAFDKNGEQGIKDVLASKEQAKTDIQNSFEEQARVMTPEQEENFQSFVKAGAMADTSENRARFLKSLAEPNTTAAEDAEAKLREEAARQVREDKQSPSLWTEGGLASYVGETLGAPVFGARSTEPTDEEINQRVTEMKAARLDAQTKADASADAKWLNSNAGKALTYINPLFGWLSEDTRNVIGSSLVGGAANATGGIYRALAGAARPFSGSTYSLLSRVAEKSETLGTKTGDDSITSEVFKTAGGLPINLSELYLVSKLPGGIVAGMGVSEGLKAAGEGKNLTGIGSAAIKGAAEGGVFELAPFAGRAAEKFGSTAVSKTLLREGATLGSIVGGTAAVDIAAGDDLKSSLKKGAVNGLFHLGMLGVNLIGRTATVSDKSGNKVNVTVTSDLKVKELKGEVENADIQMVLDPTDGVYKDSAEVGINRAGRISPTAAPNELLPENPRRAVSPDPQAQADLLKIDSRVSKVEKAINDNQNQPLTAEAIAKQTRQNVSTVEDVLLKMYAARRVEILPDQTVRLISDNAITNEGLKKAKTLFEKAQELDNNKPSEPIKLQPSPIENQIGSSDSTKYETEIQPQPPSVQKNLDVQSAELPPPEKVNRIYEALPEQKQQAEKMEKPVAKVLYKERENLADNLDEADGRVKPQRNFRAGTNDSTLVFDSEAQRDLYDYYANEKKAMAGGGQRAFQSKAKDLSALKTDLAQRLNVPESKIFDLAKQVSEDVKTQMKGVKHLEERNVADNVLPKPKAKNIAEKPNVFTERGTKASIEPKVIDSSDILTSLDEGYPQDLQPRDRSRAASKAQISEIANRLNPEFLGDSPKASDGRPLVVPVELNGQTKYAVISGNGRSEGIKGAYQLGKAADYAQFAKTKDPDTKHKEPVYVGVLDPNEIKDLPDFAKQANESATAQMSATEQAKSDAKRLDSDVLNLFVPSDDGTIHGAANRDFTRAFLQKAVPTSEQGRLVDADGKLNQDGASRVRNAIFAKAFGDSEKGLSAIQRMSESTDNNVRNITNGLLAKAGPIAVLKEAAKNGTRHKEFDIAPDLGTAMEKYADLKDSGTSVNEYILQGNLFGAETTPFQTRVMQVFDDYKRSAKAVRSIVGNFLDIADAAGDPNQKNLFGEKEAVDIKSAFEAAVKKYEDANQTDGSTGAAQAGLFGADTDQGLRLRPEAGGDVREDARPSSTEAEESGQNRISPPAYSIPPKKSSANSDSLVNELEARREAFSKLKYGDEKAEFNKSRLANAEIRADGNIIFANADAMEIIRQAHAQVFQPDSQDAFIGAYQNPVHTRKVIDALKFGVLGGQMDGAAKTKARDFIRAFERAASNPYGDTQVIATDKANRSGLRIAREEEFAHQADYRVGLEHSVGKTVVQKSLIGRKAMHNLQQGGYGSASKDALAMEVAAKMFVEGNSETGLADAERDALQLEYWSDLLNNGASINEIDKQFSGIGKIGKEFVENAKQRESERELQRSQRSDEPIESNRAEKLSFNRQSDEGTRQRNSVESTADSSRGFSNLGSGLLDSVGEGNQSLVKASPKDLQNTEQFYEAAYLEPLYAKTTPEEKNSIATMLAPIWKGNRETSVKDIATNFRRAGLLTAPKTHLKNMTSNALMQASEELARPIAILADIAASAVTGERTVQMISLPGLMKSFGALIRQDATLKALDKESGIARAWNILKNGDVSELDKNQLSEMKSGSPILDAMVNYTFRSLGAEDALFKTYAMRRSLEESAKTIAVTESRTDKTVNVSRRRAELLENPTDEMLLEAELYADFTTFTNNNPVSDAFTDIKNSNSYVKFAAETLVPYDKTPTNIVARTLEYTPLGLGWAGKHLYDLKKGDSYTFRRMREQSDREQRDIIAREKETREKINEKFDGNMKSLDEMIKNAKTDAERDKLKAEKERHLKNFQILKGKRKLEDGFREIDRQEIQDAMDDLFPRIAQQQFARSVGRSGLGSAGLALGIYLAMNGLLSGIWDAGDREEMNEFYDRKDAGILNASLKIGNRRYGIGDTPLGKVMAIGASIYERSRKPRKDGETKTTKTLGDVYDVGKTTVMEQPMLNSLDDYFGSGKTAEKRIGGLLGSFVPSIFAALADVTDDKARDNSRWYSGINRVPGARNYNKKADKPREPYLRDRTNRIIDKFDPLNTRPVANTRKVD